MEMKNRARFWTGISMMLIEVVGIVIFVLTLLDWDWLTIEVAGIVLSISAVVIYNTFAGYLIWNGSSDNNQDY